MNAVNFNILDNIERNKDVRQAGHYVTEVTGFERWAALRKLYEIMTPRILDGERFDPYIVDWTKLFTPIELDVWCYLRVSKMNFYPQYPALNYFIDFADPVRRIGIEVDGKDFHLDKRKDMNRDLKLSEAFWKIYRITGSEAVKNADYFEEWNTKYISGCEDFNMIEVIDDWLYRTAHGVIRSLEYLEYGGQQLPYNKYISGWDEAESTEKALDCLENHSYI